MGLRVLKGEDSIKPQKVGRRKIEKRGTREIKSAFARGRKTPDK